MELPIPTSNLSLFVAAVFVLAITPGPAVLYIVARSIDQGRKAGLASVLGIETGNFVHVLAAALGLSAILLSSALAFNVVKYLGAAYLIYLGLRAWMTKEPTVTDNPTFEQKSLEQIYSQGVVVSVLNPKTALFFFAFLPQFVDSSKGGVGIQVFLLGSIFVVTATTTDSTYAFLAGTAGRWLKGNLHFLKFQRYFSGSVYIGLGLVAAFSGGHKK